MPEIESSSDLLLQKAQQGDRQARSRLLDKYRDRLRKMIAVRLDHRLAARVDPSDVIQETLVNAAENLSDYLKNPPLPFYLWLRKIAWEKLIMLHRRHLDARKRSVRRETRQSLVLSEQSVFDLVGRLIGRGSSPSAGLRRQENKERLEAALLQLKEKDREVLVLRFVEQLTIAEIGAILEIKEGAVKLRQLRALERLRKLLGNGENES